MVAVQHHQRAAGHQRRHQLEHADAEAEARDRRHHVARIEAILLGGEIDVGAQVRLAGHHAFGFARGARGVVDRGRLRCLHHDGRVVRCLGIERSVVLVEGKAVPSVERELVNQVGTRQQQTRPRVIEDGADARGRVGRVQWRVDRAGFPDGQQGHCDVDTRFQAHHDNVFLPDGAGDELVRELVGTPVQLRIAQALVAVLQCHRIGRFPAAGLERFVQVVLRQVAVLAGGLLLEPALFIGRQQREPRNGHFEALGHAVQQDLQVAGETGHGRRLEELGVVDVGTLPQRARTRGHQLQVGATQLGGCLREHAQNVGRWSEFRIDQGQRRAAGTGRPGRTR